MLNVERINLAFAVVIGSRKVLVFFSRKRPESKVEVSPYACAKPCHPGRCLATINNCFGCMRDSRTTEQVKCLYTMLFGHFFPEVRSSSISLLLCCSCIYFYVRSMQKCFSSEVSTCWKIAAIGTGTSLER